MKRLRIFALMLFGLSVGSVANAQQAMIWYYDQYNDNAGATSTVTVGVPQTDNVMLNGVCAAGTPGELPRVIFSAPVGNMAEGQRISIRFISPAFQSEMVGRVFGTRIEEGVSGVELELENSNPLWGALKALKNIQYRVNGETITLPLRNSARAIERFLNDCQNYALQTAGNNEPNLPQTSNDPRHATCEQFGNVVSRKSDVPVTVTFINRSDGFRGVLWIGFDGVPKEYASLNAGEKFTINTYLTHPWMFTDGPGNCLEMYMPQQGVPIFEITAPGRYFGDE